MLTGPCRHPPDPAEKGDALARQGQRKQNLKQKLLGVNSFKKYLEKQGWSSNLEKFEGWEAFKE